MPAGRWSLAGFGDAFTALPGPVSAELVDAFLDELLDLVVNPVSPSERIDRYGPHIGETLLGDEREAAFPLWFETVIQPPGCRDAMWLAYKLDPDARLVICVELRLHRGVSPGAA